MFRKKLQTIHLWTGIVLCLPFILIGLSGSALLLQREILVRSVPSATANGDPQPLASVLAAAQAAAPENMTARLIELPQWNRAPVTVQARSSDPEQRDVKIYVDPVSLEILGQSEVVGRGPILAFLIGVHAFLMLPANIGLPVVGTMGIAMSFMGLSGLILWWPRKKKWRTAFGVSRKTRGERLYRELHRVVGIWSLAVFLTLSVSGIYLAFPQSFRAVVAMALPVGTHVGQPVAQYSSAAGPIDPDQAIASAHAAVPDARARMVQVPGRPTDTFVVEMESRGFRPGEPPILVMVDSETAQTVYIDDPRLYALGDKFLNLQHAVHFAIGLGWFWKVLVLLSGLLPLGFAITGIASWWIIRRKTVKKSSQNHP